MSNPTTFTSFRINGVDRRTHLLRAETWRTVNAVGNWMSVLRNPAGVYVGAFDVQDSFVVSVNNVLNVLMTGETDGPAVVSKAVDGESIWDEYVTLRGVDLAQDLLFHNDFERDYPDTSQQLKAVLNDVFNVQLAGLTNITYTPPVGATPVVGSFEFRKGSSFLSGIQELMRRAGYVFYVDDGYALQCGAPGFSATPVVIRSIFNDPTSNVIGGVDFQERDGDKHYNYIELYGKNPMFDGYTNLNASSWTAGAGMPSPILDSSTNVKVGGWSQVAYNWNPVSGILIHKLIAPIFNYTSWDLSKGEVGIWAAYDNTAGAPGTPGAGTCASPTNVGCRLIDGGGNIIDYFGASTQLYVGDYGYCTFPLGEKYQTGVANVADQWCQNVGASFDWSDVREIWFSCPRGGLALNHPSHFYIDGISLPIAIRGVAQNAGAQATYRRRPFVDSWSHVTTQNAIQQSADTLLAQSESTFIGKIKATIPGDPRLRYAGQTVTVDVPSMGINGELFYLTSIHHIVEPYADLLSGFDYVTEVEAAPISGVSYDQSRLRNGPVFSAFQMGERSGVGLNLK